MKIIAKSKNGYLLEATNDEIANLHGLYSAYAFKQTYGEAPELQIGSDVPIAAMYRRLTAMAAVPGQLVQAKKTLEAAATLLSVAENITRPVLAEEA